MTIEKTFTTLSQDPSDAGNISDRAIVVLEGSFTGFVWVECKASNSDDYIEVPGTRKYGPDVFILEAPDSTVDYRLTATRLKGTCNAYIGPTV